MTSLIRASSLASYPGLVRELGGDPVALLRAARIDPESVGAHQRFIPYASLAIAVGSAAHLLDRPDFPLLLAERQGISILGPLAVVIRHSETFAEALDGASQYLHTYSPAIGVTLQRGLDPRLEFIIYTSRLPFRAQMVELSLGVTIQVMRLLAGDDFVPRMVSVRHQPLGPASMYRSLLGTEMRFQQQIDAVHLLPHTLQHRVSGVDTRARAIAEEYLASARPRTSISDQVRDLTDQLLPLGRATLVEVARATSLHPRTLQRQLASAGTSFDDIVESSRRAMAWELAATSSSARQIATLLGYSEQSSYTRACRRWFGLSPKALALHRRGNPLDIDLGSESERTVSDPVD